MEDQVILPRVRDDISSTTPLVITGVFGHYRTRYMMCDGGSSSDIMYQQCFDQLDIEDKNRMEPVNFPIMGFFKEVIHPIGMIPFAFTLTDGKHTRSEMCNIYVIPSTSQYDILLGREGLVTFNCNASTPRQMMGFPTRTGVAYIKGNQECLITETPESSKAPPKAAKPSAINELEKWVLNPKFPEQTITLGPALSEYICANLK